MQHNYVLAPCIGLSLLFTFFCLPVQWKIRRVLAHSLHELARILGAGRTSSDLLPIFEEYCTKDVDDVKVGVLAHLAEFFEVRNTHIYKFASFPGPPQSEASECKALRSSFPGFSNMSERMK